MRFKVGDVVVEEINLSDSLLQTFFVVTEINKNQYRCWHFEKAIYIKAHLIDGTANKYRHITEWI